MRFKTISKHIKSKASLFSIFSVFILVLVASLVFSLVKHQQVQLQRQIVVLEVTGRNWQQLQNQTVGFDPPYWIVDQLKIGMKEYSPDGRVIAEVVDAAVYETDNSSYKAYLAIEVETVDSFSTGRTVYKGRNVLIGEQLDFYFDSIRIVGQVISIHEKDFKFEFVPLKVSVEIRSLPSYLYNQVSVGDSITDLVTEKKYVDIITKDLRFSTDHTLFQHPYTSNLTLRQDFELRDVFMDLTMYTQKVNGRYYFAGDQQIKVGSDLELYFDRYNLTRVKITDVSEAEVVSE